MLKRVCVRRNFNTKSHRCIMAIGLNSVYLTEMENYFNQSNWAQSRCCNTKCNKFSSKEKILLNSLYSHHFAQNDWKRFQEFAIHFNNTRKKAVFMRQKLCGKIQAHLYGYIVNDDDDLKPIKINSNIRPTLSISHHKCIMIAENFHYCLYFIHNVKSFQP